MKILVAYATKYGCTEKCAHILSEKLNGEVDLYNLKDKKSIDLSKYEKVIVGGSIYLGKIQKEVTEFCEANFNRLLEKKTGLFICCMREAEFAKTQLLDSFANELTDAAIVKETFGGEFIFSKMSFMDKLITKKVAKVSQDTSDLIEENIYRFAQLMNKA